MLDTKSIYALNKKDPEAIVYTDADKNIIRLTREDFGTETEFLKWKHWSDKDYHDGEKGNHVERNHTAPMTELRGSIAVSDGPEVIIEQQFEKLTQEQHTAEMMMRVKRRLTEKQFRRRRYHYVSRD